MYILIVKEYPAVNDSKIILRKNFVNTYEDKKQTKENDMHDWFRFCHRFSYTPLSLCFSFLLLSLSLAKRRHIVFDS